MIKKLFTVLAFALLATKVEAALISRTYSYTSGNTMSANENNTNENTIYNEFNGNISAANILDGSLTNADIADTQFTRAKFASAVQSTFTYVDSLGAYRRPVLTFISLTAVDVENNTGTSNETCIQFPDERRCVTENTGSTSVNRRFIITEAASQSGTKNSGLAPGESKAVNTWYAIYAVKATDVSTDFVLAGSTNTPSQSNYATLNSRFGTNSWVYLGSIRNGDNSGTTDGILGFYQAGNLVKFYNTIAGGSTSAGNPATGLRLANTAGASSLGYTYSAGTGASNLPSNLTLGVFTISCANPNTTITVTDSGSAFDYIRLANQNNGVFLNYLSAIKQGAAISTSSSNAMDIFISAFYDGSLGIGFNPQL